MVKINLIEIIFVVRGGYIYTIKLSSPPLPPLFYGA